MFSSVYLRFGLDGRGALVRTAIRHLLAPYLPHQFENRTALATSDEVHRAGHSLFFGLQFAHLSQHTGKFTRFKNHIFKVFC